jgi:tetratricopeptide (TPR) repeat protein
MKSMRIIMPLILLVCSVMAWPWIALADTVHLKNGKTLDGEVIREDKEAVVIRVPYGEIKLKPEDVDFVERQTATEYKITLGRRWLQQREYERAVKVLEEGFIADKSSSDARRMLATAYDQQGFHLMKVRRLVEARGVYENLLKIDPDAKHIRHNAKEALAAIRKQEGDLESILHAARAYAKLKQWSHAIEAYSQALSYSPDVNTIVGVEMAECYVQRAQQYALARNFLNAAGDFEAAMRSDPAQAAKVEHIYLTCALPTIFDALSRGDIRTARVDLERVVTYVPTSRSAMYVSGRVEEALKNFGGAAEHYARALRTRAVSSTPEHVAELRRQVEKDLSFEGDKIRIDTAFTELTGFAKSDNGPARKLETENFTIVHYNEQLANELAGRAESERIRLIRDLRLRGWDGKTTIYIHRTQAEYTARTGLPEWSGAFSRYNMDGGRVANLEIHSWQTSPRLLTTILPHEIMHILLFTNSPNPMAIPHGLHEGFALLAEPRFRQEHMLNFLRIRMRSEEFIPLADLLTMRGYPKDPEFLYAEGYALILYLVTLRGLEATCGLITSVGNTGSAQEEIIKLSGFNSLEKLEENWKQWLLAQK